VSCARETFEKDLSIIPISQIPNKERLKPSTPHVKHTLFDGMLLYAPAVTSNGEDGPLTGRLCGACLKSLNNNEMPRFSLANDLWVGDIPHELAKLTLPERILIAKYYPVAYIVKLYPKQRGANAWDEKQLHRGLRGNVSTYKLDPQLIAETICVSDPLEMPPPAKVLSATVGVTFIGPKGLTVKSMPQMLRVRRAAVRDALVCLKENNATYLDIKISEARLEELPEDGIPQEILSTTRHLDDISLVYREHDGYVPSQEEEGRFNECLLKKGD